MRHQDTTGNISDIFDGEKYKSLQQRGWFQSAGDIGIVCSTDGGALFKSSGVSAWPVWAVIANLDPSVRYVTYITSFWVQ